MNTTTASDEQGAVVAAQERAVDLRTARLRALINLGLDLSAERNRDQLLARVCSAACDLFGATYVTLGIVRDHSRTLQRIATCGSADVTWIKPGGRISGLLETVVTERRLVRGNNTDDGQSALEFPPGHPEVREFLAAPIASAVKVYGWICLVGNAGRNFTEEDEHLITALSSHVGRIYELEDEIVERRQAEGISLKERDRAQSYLDAVDVIVLALDLDGRVTLINRKGCELLGWTEAELKGRDWVDTCVPPRLRPRVRQHLESVSVTSHHIFENPILTRAGKEHPVEWCNTAIRDEEGRLTGSLSSGTDIAKRNLAITSLKRAEERMRFALEASGVGIWDIDFATSRLQWSEILEAQYGLAPGSFDGTLEAFIGLIHPEDRDGVISAMRKASESGKDFSLHHRIVWPDGTIRWIAGAGRIHLDQDREPSRGIGISMDVTDRQHLEAQYQQSQKMEAVGQLAAGVAHDFNNVLTAILGYCELLLTDFPADDSHRADIEEIQKAGASAARLTHQLLSFSRKEIIQPTILDLNAVVDGMRVLIGRLAGENVTIVTKLLPGLARMKADRGQVEQVILNLAVNARDAMAGGGTLTIATANVETGDGDRQDHQAPTMPGKYVVLTVTDTGTGMTPQVQERIFEPFFTTKERGTGTGLGLATVHGIAMQNGGAVAVHSEIGKGACFNVYFPEAIGATLTAEAAPALLSVRGRETVLVVDDAEGLRKLTRRLLERHGYTVIVAGSSAEARQAAANVPIDVLLTDVVMPGGSGMELAQELLKARPDLKVIYMSGYAETTIIRHGVLDPGIAFVHKPFTSETLRQKVREVLSI